MISAEIAYAEVEKWLAFKKLNPARREAKKEAIEKLTSLIMDGTFVLNEDMELVQTLNFEVGETLKINKLSFKPRLSMQALRVNMRGVDMDDPIGFGIAYVAALTGQPKNIIQALDSEDFNAAQAIMPFFS